MKQAQGRGVELIVGIPSYMEADTIGFVTKQIELGLQRYFSGMGAVIINVDNNSEDDTRGAFLSTETVTPKLYMTTPKGVKGKGNNLMNLFRYVRAHKSNPEGGRGGGRRPPVYNAGMDQTLCGADSEGI